MLDWLGGSSAVVVFLLGLLASVAIEALHRPRVPLLRKPPAGWLVQAGAWAIGFAALYALTARPWFSALNVLSAWLLVVLVSNAKYHSLREPFVCADFEYFSDAIRFPRLYLPFFGIGKAIVLALLYVGLLAGGLYLEPAQPGAWKLAAVLATLGLCAFLLARGLPLKPNFEPLDDLRRLGFAGALWSYYRAARQPVDRQRLPSPFALPRNLAAGADLVVVQSESFFDARRLWPGIRPQVLEQFDRLCRESVEHGRLGVAAWGANTVRTEFSFLSGLPGDALGVHRFNPYRILARRGVPSLASALKAQGYRTVCVHPYTGAFYGRDKVLPALGFDTFIDLSQFSPAQRSGPFIGDVAVAERIRQLLGERDDGRPLFVYAITMENHGPLHLESLGEDERPTYFNAALPDACRDLGPYVRHLANADRMLRHLRETLLGSSRPATLCFYGDHVPILPGVYGALGTPDGDTEYLIWRNDRQGAVEAPRPDRARPVESLASALLDHLSAANARGAA